MTQIVTMVIKPEREQEFIDLATEVAKQAHENEPGTVLYVLTKHPTEAHTYVWVERYRDEEALSAHTGMPYVTAALSSVQDMWAAPPELLKLTQIVPQ